LNRETSAGLEVAMVHPKSYKTFEEFEKEELLRIDTLYSAIDDIVDELFLDGVDGARSREESDLDEW
jgi:hypothetical protein